MMDMDDPRLDAYIARDLGKALVWCRFVFRGSPDLMIVGYAGICICGDLSMRASLSSAKAQDERGAQIVTAQQVLDVLGYGPCADHDGGKHRGLVRIKPFRFSAHAEIRVITEIRSLLTPQQEPR
ncbi:hypothetical protein SAMN05444413_1174 [Roseivivax marinus]|uniref:hypothetical protein n=1 Tax=Roseivivax marinus TaxID=1379903 RepID=UPI0008ABD6E1|nr:hypothetical protein [Roseivivax marinus]SEL81262.1 hypothetical protein SAMN05444413_1174 [Roseivivax marinus]